MVALLCRLLEKMNTVDRFIRSGNWKALRAVQQLVNLTMHYVEGNHDNTTQTVGGVD